MAYFTWSAALTAIREVIESAHGSLRTIPAGRFTDDLVEGLSEDELNRRGVRADIPIRVRFTASRKNPASPPINGSTIIRDHDLEVVVSRTITPEQQADADAYATLQALAMEDREALEQALCTPPNLATTVAGTATGICGDALIYRGSDTRVTGTAPPSKAQRFETIHRFTMTAVSRPAT